MGLHETHNGCARSVVAFACLQMLTVVRQMQTAATTIVKTVAITATERGDLCRNRSAVMQFIRVFVFAKACSLLPVDALAWDGVDTITGNSFRIEDGNLVRSGNNIEIYDYVAGEYRLS